MSSNELEFIHTLYSTENVTVTDESWDPNVEI